MSIRAKVVLVVVIRFWKGTVELVSTRLTVSGINTRGRWVPWIGRAVLTGWWAPWRSVSDCALADGSWKVRADRALCAVQPTRWLCAASTHTLLRRRRLRPVVRNVGHWIPHRVVHQHLPRWRWELFLLLIPLLLEDWPGHCRMHWSLRTQHASGGFHPRSCIYGRRWPNHEFRLCVSKLWSSVSFSCLDRGVVAVDAEFADPSRGWDGGHRPSATWSRENRSRAFVLP